MKNREGCQSNPNSHVVSGICFFSMQKTHPSLSLSIDPLACRATQCPSPLSLARALTLLLVCCGPSLKLRYGLVGFQLPLPCFFIFFFHDPVILRCRHCDIDQYRAGPMRRREREGVRGSLGQEYLDTEPGGRTTIHWTLIYTSTPGQTTNCPYMFYVWPWTTLQKTIENI